MLHASNDNLLLQDALSLLERADEKIKALEREKHEPVAIIGMACRFPGGALDPKSFFELLRDGRDGIGTVPQDRWDVEAWHHPDPDTPGKIHSRFGGFVGGCENFDAAFFEISPREAESLDPQQRMLLEVAWEAMEGARLAPLDHFGSRTGVFIGISGSDYLRFISQEGAEGINAYLGTGNAHSSASGRLSYFFGFKGPSMSVDTACSSSLVAIHAACQSLRLGESKMALAGGVNHLLMPDMSVNFSKAKMLAPDGRCKSFDASANGYVRAEGCGVVVLKRLSDALAAGDPVLAVIRGSAVNQDGRSGGLTVPNGPAQEMVLREALKNAGLQPSQVSFIEAHGTGTPLGDPIEADALGAVFGGRSANNPLWIGSVKSNIGHLESAAGIAGLIKLVLCLQHKELPRTLHFKRPNPLIAWESLPLRVVADHVAWETGPTPRVAGVSSFGFSGTNAHVLVEEFVPPSSPLVSAKVPPARPWQVLALSARGDGALRELARQYAGRVGGLADVDLPGFCASAALSRNHFENRRVFVEQTAAAMAKSLADFAAGTGAGPARIEKSRIGFVFTGQGSQYPDMGRGLYDSEPVFRATVDRLAGLLESESDIPLLEVLYPAPDAAGVQPSRLDNTAFSQPALFVVEYALAELWRSWGIEPEAVAGHSVGEYVAAAVAGIFSAEEGLRLIARRARCLASLPAGGGMSSVFADRARVERTVGNYPESLSIAAINGPEHVVIAGALEDLAEVTEALRNQGVRSKPLNVSHAFHSPLTEPILETFRQAANAVDFQEPHLDFVSALTGQVAAVEPADPEYWVRHIRQPVLFHDALGALDRLNCRLLLEIGPQPVLSGLMAANGGGPGRVCAPSLRRNRDDRRQMIESLGQLYEQGAPVNWAGYHRGQPGRSFDLPAYPFEHKRHWFKPTGAARRVPAPATPGRNIAPEPFARRFQANGVAGGHRVFGQVLVPAAAFLEMALTLADQAGQAWSGALQDFRIHRALPVSANSPKRVQCIATPGDSGPGRYEFRGGDEADPDGAETVCAEVRITDATLEEAAAEPLDHLRARFANEIAVQDFYARCRRRGFDYGTDFRLITQLFKEDTQALARIKVSETAQAAGRVIDTCALDACFQVLMTLLPPAVNISKTWLPVGLQSLHVLRQPRKEIWCHAELHSSAANELSANLRLLDEDGRTLAVIRGLAARQASRSDVAGDGFDLEECLYRQIWERRGLFAPVSNGAWLPAPGELEGELRRTIDDAAGFLNLARCGEGIAALNSLVTGYIATAFRRLGCALRKGDRFSATDIQAVGRQQAFLRRLLEILRDDGVLQEEGGKWLVVCAPDNVFPGDANRALREQYPEIAAELILADRCGSALAKVLAGDCEPVAELLFPEQEAVTAASLFRDARGSRVFHQVLQTALAEILQRVPGRRGLRILEVGAGMDGTITALVPHLDGARIEYHLADVSRAMFTDMAGAATQRIRSQLADYSFVRYLRLDLEKDPLGQGFEPGSYDLVIAPNILHATQDLRRGVSHLRRLMAPGGLFLVLEGTTAQPWVDLVYGMTAAWWSFSDRETRPKHPLIAPAAWERLLHESGCSEARSFVCEPAGQALLLARGSGAPELETARREHWLILGGARGVGKKLADLLALEGAGCTLVVPGREYRRVDEGTIQIDPSRSADFQKLVASLGVGSATHCVHLWAADEAIPFPAAGSLPERAQAICESALHLVQALTASNHAGPAPRLAIVTRAAVAVAGESLPGLAASPLWGLGKSVALEHPELGCLCLDLPAEAGPDEARALRDEIRNRTEDQVALRDRHRHVARVIRDGGPAPQEGFECRPEAAYLITGGLGDLGLHAAEWLADRGARHLVLAARRGTRPEAEERIRRLGEAGVRLTVRAMDVADERQTDELFRELAALPTPLRGIIHAAGIFSDGTLRELTPERLAAVLAPKVAGAWHLHTWSRNLPLDFFLLYSSAASLFGSAGQASYVSANAFLDALAAERRAGNLPAVSINWGGWTQIGHAARTGADSFLQRRGIGSITPAQGAAALDRALGGGSGQIGVVPVDWPKFFAAQVSTSSLFAVFAALGTKADPANAPHMEALAGKSPKEAQAWVLNYVATQVAAVLGLEAVTEVAHGRTFIQMGMDSLTSVELRNRLQKGLGLALAATLAFEFPTVPAMAGHLTRLVQPEAPDDDACEPVGGDSHEPELSDEEATALLAKEIENLAASSLNGEAARAAGSGLSPAQRALRAWRAARDSMASSRAAAATAAEPIAVIGLGCRFPGGADSPRKFLELLLEGRDAISEVPRDRWDAAAWYDPDPDVPGKINCRHGGFVEGFEGFDAAFFGIAPREARSLDPQHRMLLEVSWEALENAGMAPGELAGANTGVFVGITSHDYYNLVVGGDPHRIDPYLGTGNAHSSASGRLSYFFGFKGPSVSLDTACSSALVAIHSACQSLRTGETDMALAGGVNHLLLPEMSVNFAKAHMLAPDGRCKAFDARANGYVRSEGCGMVVLKRLSTAVAAGDPILAVVRGSAVNQDGRSGGLTVPSRSAQAAVIRRSLSMAGIGPDSVGFVEAHGTGTSLGDPIEVQALQDVFGKRDPGDPLWIGSVKSNLGHLESAAGVASFIKAVLCLQVRDLAPSLHFETPNPHIHWDQMPIKVASRKREWKTSGRRVAGVSSFSFSGTNAHLVLEEAPASAPSLPQEAAPGLPPRVDHGLVLSAQSEAALRDLAGRYAARLAELPPGRCGDLCATAAVFKDCFDHRLFLVKDSADGLRAALASFAAEGECEPPDAVGRIPGGPGQTKVGFIFPDQQLAYPDPGGQLYRGEPVFRQAAGRLAASLEGELKIPLLQTLFPGPEIAPNTERDWRDDPANAHAALYILEFALAELWRSWGVTPEIVLGHGVGEYVAAAVAGVFSPEDGLRMVLARAGLHSEFQREDAKDGPLDRIRPGLTEEQRRRFRAIANLVTYHRPRISLVSGASGRLVDREVAFAEYWERHLQAPVRPDLGRETLDDSQIHEFVEMGPEPFWGAPAGPPKVAGTKAAAFLPSLQPQVAPRRQCIEILGRLFVHGVTVDWPAYYRGRFTRQSQLPTYPFQHQRYWCDSTDQCYRVTWKQQPLPRSPLAADRGRWLILADQDWPELARAFGENGRRSVFVPSGAGSQTGEVTFRAQERYRQLLAEGGPWEGIVYAWQATADWTSGTREIGDFGLSRLVDLTGALAALENPPKLWLTTRGGTSTAAAGLQSPFSAALLGLGRCLFLEHPRLKGGMLDLDMVATKGEAGRVRDELLDPQSEDCVALRENLRFVNRLESARPAAAPALKLSRSGAYLITGGLGALGLQTARHLVDHQAGCVVLMGRGATSDATLKALRPLEQRGSRILVVRGDVTDETAVAAVLETIKANQFELRGIVHAAGVNSRRLVMELEPGQLRGALAPKVAGALNLHRLTAGAPLDFFVCFSSIAAVWGSARQAHYAAANAFLDGLVEYRRARGQKGLAVNWGPWEGDGMSKADGGRRVTESGLRLLGPDLAFVLLDQLLASGESRATVADVDWARLKSLYEVRGRQPLFEKVLGETPQGPAFKQAPFVTDLGAAAPSERFELMAQALEALFADVVPGAGDEKPGRDEGFFDLGVDSLMAVQIRAQVQQLLGRELPTSLCFDYPTITSMSEFLLRELFPEDEKIQPLKAANGAPRTVPAARTTTSNGTLDGQVQELSDEQITALIEDEMKALNLE